MTLVRKLALKISDTVVRWASPGCKEWAEGLKREVRFIGGDWAALVWAIGSTRVLVDRRSAPFGTEVSLRKPRVVDVCCWILFFVQGLTCAANILVAKSWWNRTGWSLVGFAFAYWGVTSVADWRRERRQPSTSDIEAYRLFLRKGLELKLGRYRSARRWFPVLATMSLATGYLMNIEGGIHLTRTFSGVVIAVAAFGIWLQSLETPEKIEKRIERMDAQIAQVR